MTATPIPVPRFFWRDPDTDTPLVGGKVTFYMPGTTTLSDVWADADKTATLTNPVILEADGGADIYGEGEYKIRITRADDTLVHEIDNVVCIGAGGGAGGGSLNGTEVVYTADHTIILAEQGYLVVANRPTAINFAFDPAATLGSGFMVIVRNIGLGTLTLNPSGSEQIDGRSTKPIYAGESVLVTCNGSAFRTSLIGQKKSEFRTVAELQEYRTDQPAYSVYVAYWDDNRKIGSGARYKLVGALPTYGAITDGDGRFYEIAELIVNPFQFGATGDGLTVDTLAMQAWMQIERNKFLPPGTFLINAEIPYVGSKDVVIEGSGYATSVIRAAHATGNMISKTGAGSLIMRDVGFTTSINRTSGACVYLGGAGGFRDFIDNCRFAGSSSSVSMYRGVEINIGTIATIRACYFLTCSAAAIVLANATTTAGGEHVIDGCTFNTVIATPNASTACQWFSGLGALRFTNCIVQNYDYGVSYQPVTTQNKADLLVTGCTFEATSLYGVLCSLPAASAAMMQIMTVADCNFTMATGYCIATVGATNDQWINDIRIDCAFRFGGTAAILINAGITCSIDPGCLFDSTSNTKAMISSAARPTFGWIGKTFVNLTTPYNRNGNAGWSQYNTIALP